MKKFAPIEIQLFSNDKILSILDSMELSLLFTPLIAWASLFVFTVSLIMMSRFANFLNVIIDMVIITILCKLFSRRIIEHYYCLEEIQQEMIKRKKPLFYKETTLQKQYEETLELAGKLVNHK